MQAKSTQLLGYDHGSRDVCMERVRYCPEAWSSRDGFGREQQVAANEHEAPGVFGKCGREASSSSDGFGRKGEVQQQMNRRYYRRQMKCEH